MKIILVLIALNSIDAHLRDDTKKIYVGAGLIPVPFQNETQYKELAAKEFNCLTPGLSMKWGHWEPTRGSISTKDADMLVKFAQQNGMKVRGHTLIWHISLPKWVNALENNKQELHKVMVKHITEEVNYFKGKIYAWDVLNEVVEKDGTIRESLWYKNFGLSYMIDAFNLARQNDPNAKLYINEYDVYGENNSNPNKTEGYYNLLKQLLAKGVPVQGVGFQCHFQVGLFPKDLAKTMQRFADLGVDVAITELDVKIKLPATPELLKQQALDYAQAYKACLSVKRCVGVTVWDFTDKYSWIPDSSPGFGSGDLWDESYKPKPAVSAVEAVLKSAL